MTQEQRAKAIDLIAYQQSRVNRMDIEDMTDEQLIESILWELEAAIEQVEEQCDPGQ